MKETVLATVLALACLVGCEEHKCQTTVYGVGPYGAVECDSDQVLELNGNIATCRCKAEVK